MGGEADYVLSNENMEELAGCIVKLLDDDNMRGRMGESIREKMKEYDWGRISGKTVQICEQVIVDFGNRDTQNI